MMISALLFDGIFVTMASPVLRLPSILSIPPGFLHPYPVSVIVSPTLTSVGSWFTFSYGMP